MRFHCLVLSLVFTLAACNIPTATPAAEKAAPPAVKPPDHARWFPSENRVNIELVDDHVLGRDFLPGGNVAEYKKDGKTYTTFLVETKNPEAAAMLMFEYKGKLSGAKFLAHMGGYYGMDGDTPALVFPKQQYVMGVLGLAEKEADMAGRELAARVR